MRSFPEADWRVLRDLAPIALERFCKRVLDEAAPLVTGPSQGYHDRYLALFKLLHERDDELAAAFNDLRRSSALTQLTYMRRLQLFTEEEFVRFSEGTRHSVDMLVS